MKKDSKSPQHKSTVTQVGLLLLLHCYFAGRLNSSHTIGTDSSTSTLSRRNFYFDQKNSKLELTLILIDYYLMEKY